MRLRLEAQVDYHQPFWFQLVDVFPMHSLSGKGTSLEANSY